MIGSPLSMDLRRRIVDAYESGEGTYDELAERFAVGSASVSRLLRLQRETGDVEPRERGGGNPACIGPEDGPLLAELVSAMPDASSGELAEAWRNAYGPCSRSAMLRALKRFGLTLKKSLSERSSSSRRASNASGKRFSKI